MTDFPTDKIRALLAYLAVEADKPHRRDALATLLWPDYTDAVALRNLRQSLHRLRQTLDAIDADLSQALFAVTRQTIALNSQVLDLDTARLQQQLATVAGHPHPLLYECEACLATLERAVKGYEGELLQGFLLENAVAFDEWQTMQREHFHQQVIASLQQLIEAQAERQDYRALYRFATQLLTLEPWREEAHQWAMRALAGSGQRSEALAQYERCRALLAAELGVEPSEVTTELYRQIRRDALAPALPPTPVTLNPQPAVPSPRPRTGFPRSYGKFLGRTAEVAQLTAYLTAEECRLVTLIGPGGSGKTRLAGAVAKAYLSQADCTVDGCVFVALASVTNPALSASAIATALGLQLHEQASHMAQLVDFLRHKQLLLVLDNFEQIVESAPLLVEILTECRAIKLLVTSRVALNLRQEQRFAVGGLAYPEAKGPALQATLAAAPEPLLEQSALQLFVQAARQVQPDFMPTGETVTAIAQICALVQGMPLALELAATWVRLADCATIAHEISTNLDFLSISAHDMPVRHRSMRAVFAQSWQLISATERRVLAQLATFAGGFTLEAMLAVTDGSVIDLANLLDWSLIQRTTKQRYGLHELLRQFAEAELAAWPTAQTNEPKRSSRSLMTHTRQRHSDYFLGLVAQLAAAFYGAQPQSALHAMRRDLDNIRAAWHWAIDAGNFATLAQAGDGFAEFLFLEGLLQEGEASFAAAVARIQQSADERTDESTDQGRTNGESAPSATTPTATAVVRVRGHLLVQQANFLIYQGKLTQAQPLLVEALAAMVSDDGVRSAQAHNALGDLLRVKGDYDEALTHLQTALAQYERHNHTRGQAHVFNNIGQLYWAKSAYEHALAQHQRALQLARQIDNRLEIAQCLSSMGLVYYRQSSYAQALDCHRQALTVAEALGNRHDIAKHLSNMGVVYYDQGDFAAATTYLERALTIDRDLGNRLGIAKRQTNLGMIYMRTGDYRQALAGTQEAYHLVVAMEHQSGIALTLGNIGVILFQMGEYEQALSHHRQALALDETLGNQDSVARHLGNIGASHANLGDLTQALQHYDRALALHRTLNTRYHWAQTLLRKADALYQLSDYAAAVDYQQEGLQMAREIKRADAIFEGELLAAKLAQVQGKPAEAVAQLNRLLRNATGEYEQATLHDQLWQLQHEPFHAQRALTLYLRLLEKAPSKEYRHRVVVLTQAGDGGTAPA